MNRKEITKQLAQLTEKYINPHNDPRIYSAKEVTFDYATAHAIRVDYMQFKPVNNTAGGIEKGLFYCYEIKSCVDDFNSGHGKNFIGDYNYLVMPHELYIQVQRSIPYDVGVLIPSADCWRALESVKKAKQKVRQYTAEEMLLMMYRSTQRELIKEKRLRGQ